MSYQNAVILNNADSQMGHRNNVGGIVDSIAQQNAKILHVFELKRFEDGGNKWVSKRTETPPDNITTLMEVDEFLDQVDNIFDRRSFGFLKLVLLRITVIAMAIGIGIGVGFAAVTEHIHGGVKWFISSLWILLASCVWYYVEERKDRQKEDLSKLVSAWKDKENSELNAGLCLKLDDLFWETIYPPRKMRGIPGLFIRTTTYDCPCPKIYLLSIPSEDV